MRLFLITLGLGMQIGGLLLSAQTVRAADFSSSHFFVRDPVIGGTILDTAPSNPDAVSVNVPVSPLANADAQQPMLFAIVVSLIAATVVLLVAVMHNMIRKRRNA